MRGSANGGCVDTLIGSSTNRKKKKQWGEKVPQNEISVMLPRKGRERLPL